jgi:hypothetical protein
MSPEAHHPSMKEENPYDSSPLPVDKRRAELIRLTRDGLGLNPIELREVVDPAYDLEAMRLKDVPGR